MADNSLLGGILAALTNSQSQQSQTPLQMGGLFGLGIPQGNVTNAQGQVVYPTNALERLLQGSDQSAQTMAAAFIGPGRTSLPRLQSTPVVRINGENYIGYTHEGALERAALSRGMNESVNDLVDGLGGWNKVRDNHFGYLNLADEFVPMREAMDPMKYR